MHLLLTLVMALNTLAIDLAGIKAEPKLEKRSELALHYADASLDSARDFYKKGDLDACRAALGEVEEKLQKSGQLKPPTPSPSPSHSQMPAPGGSLGGGINLDFKSVISEGGTQAQVQIDITRNLKAQATISAGTSATATQGAGAQDTGGTLGLSYQFEY